jgi:predicted ATPase
MMANNWYVITGGPSTGKTTLLAELEKLGYKTIPEAARTLIDQALSKGVAANELRADEKKFQEDQVRLKEKNESSINTKLPVFFDRGMHDTIGYMRYYNFNVEDWIEEIMHKSRYQKVFLLEPLPIYHRDYARTENDDFIQNIHELLHDTYTEFGMEPISVPAVDLDGRVKFILDKVKIRQNV